MNDFGMIGAFLETPTHLTAALVVDHTLQNALQDVGPHFPDQVKASQQAIHAANAPVAHQPALNPKMPFMQPVNEGPVPSAALARAVPYQPQRTMSGKPVFPTPGTGGPGG